MSAQEELEKLEREIRTSLSTYVIPLGAWADRISAISDGLGKAKEPAAWVTPLRCGQQVTFYKPPTPSEFLEAGTNEEWYCLPLYYAPPPADYAQDLPYVVTPKHGEWVPCTPELLNSGVDCGSTLRRACEGGGHDHYVVADSAQGLVESESECDARNAQIAIDEIDRMAREKQALVDALENCGKYTTLAEVRRQVAEALAAHKSEVKG